MTILTHTCILCILAFWLHSHTSHIFTITISLGNSRNHFICHLFHYSLLHSAQDKWIIYFHCSTYWLWHPSPRTFPWVIGVFDICPYYFYKVSWLLPNKNFIPVHLYFTPLQQVTVICPHARVTSNVWPAGGRNTVNFYGWLIRLATKMYSSSHSSQSDCAILPKITPTI